VLSSTISTLRNILWASLDSLVTFIIVLLWSGTGYSFSSFPTESYIELLFFFWEVWFPFLLFFPFAPLSVVQLCSW
jgi:hypothetical protein